MSQSSTQAALDLSNILLEDLELSRLPLMNCLMKGCRLARLVGDSDMLQILQYELSGYPGTANGLSSEIWSLAVKANRMYETKSKDGKIVQKCYRDSIEALEGLKTSSETRLAKAKHAGESSLAMQDITKTNGRLSKRRAFLYSYVLKKHMELRVSSPSENIFASYRKEVDELLSHFIPQDLTKIDSIADNIESENPEDWANAAHTCRRLLQALADKLFPPTSDRVTGKGKNTKTIKLGSEKYINRLIAFCEDNASSSVFENLVGSHLSFIGNRLDAIFKGAQKGSHASLSLEEAKRIVIFSYLCVGDILKLAGNNERYTTEEVTAE